MVRRLGLPLCNDRFSHGLLLFGGGDDCRLGLLWVGDGFRTDGERLGTGLLGGCEGVRFCLAMGNRFGGDRLGLGILGGRDGIRLRLAVGNRVACERLGLGILGGRDGIRLLLAVGDL